MELVFALLAGSADVSSQGGLVVFEPGLDAITFDHDARTVSLLAKFSFERSEIGVKHQLELILHDPNKESQRIGKIIDLEGPEMPADATTTTLLFVAKVKIAKPEAGPHSLELLFDGVRLKRIPFSIYYSHAETMEVTNAS